MLEEAARAAKRITSYSGLTARFWPEGDGTGRHHAHVKARMSRRKHKQRKLLLPR